jgi:hypothetical protein
MIAGALVGLVGEAVSVVIIGIARLATGHGSRASEQLGAHPGVVLFGPIVFGAVFGAIGGLWERGHSASIPS